MDFDLQMYAAHTKLWRLWLAMSNLSSFKICVGCCMQQFAILLGRPIVRKIFMINVPEMTQRFRDGSKCFGDSLEMCWRFPEDVLETQRDTFEMHQRHTKDAQEMRSIQHAQDIHSRWRRDAIEMHLQRHQKCIVEGNALDIHLRSSEMQMRCARGAQKMPLMKRWSWGVFEVIRNSVSCFKNAFEVELRFA